MSRFINDNLELWDGGGTPSFRCTVCRHVLCPEDQDWREACRVRLVAPRREPVVRDLVEAYSYRERCCRNCGTLLETDLAAEGETR